MSFAVLPRELLYEVALRVPFNDLRSLCQTHTEFRSLCQDPRFWQLKAQRDFGTSRKIFDLLGFTGSDEPLWRPAPQTRYLEILSEHGCTYESAELIDLDTALDCAASKGDFDLTALYLFQFVRKYPLPPAESDQRLISIISNRAATSLENALELASLSGNLDIVKSLISLIYRYSRLPNGEPIYDTTLYTSIAMTGAAKLNHRDMLEYLFSLGLGQSDSGINYAVYGAAWGHREDLIDTFLNPQDPKNPRPQILSLIKGAARGGHLDLVQRFTKDQDLLAFRTAFISAAGGGSIGVMEYFINHGIASKDDFSIILGYATLQAAQNGQTAALQFLYSRFPNKLSIAYTDHRLKYAAAGGHLDTVKFLLTHHPSTAGIERSWISVASSNHLDIAEFLRQDLESHNLTRSKEQLINSILKDSVKNGSREGVQYAMSLGATLSSDLIAKAVSNRQYSMERYLRWIIQ